MTFRSSIFAAVATFAASVSSYAEPPEGSIARDLLSGAHVISWEDPTDGRTYRLASSETLAEGSWELLPLTAVAGDAGGQEQVVPSPETSEDAPTRLFYRLQAVDPDPDAETNTWDPGENRVEFDLPADPEDPNGEQRRRSLYVFIPDSYSPPARLPGGAWPCPDGVGHPLAIILHGAGQTAASFQSRHPDLIAKCNAEDMILIVPQGELNPLNGNYGWNGAESPLQRDDLRVLVLLRELALRVLFVDPDRVHVGGFSNGGVMSMLASHSLPRLFASSAAVGSSIRSENLAMGIVSEVPLKMAAHPVMLVNAKNDLKRPFGGGVADGVLQASFADGQLFLRDNHCGGASSTIVTSNLPGGSLAYTREFWCQPPHLATCLSEFEVSTFALEGGGHQWPDADDGVGFDANEEVIDFFLRHRIDAVEDYGNLVGIPQTAGGTRGPLPGVGIDVAFDIPSLPVTPKGLVVFCHGPGIDHETFMDFTEMTAFAQDSYAEDLGWVAYSANHSSRLWDLQNPPATNEDVLNLLRIRARFINLGYINNDTPIIPVGFDCGAHFAMMAAHLLHSMELPVGGCGLLNPDWSQALPAAAAQAKAETLVPAWSFTQENDAVAHPVQVWSYHQTLRYRHPGLRHYSVMDIGREKCPSADRFDRITPVVDGDLILDHLEAEGLIDVDGHRVPCKREIGSTLANLNPPTHLGYSLEQLAEVFTQIQVMFAAHHPEAPGETRFFDYVGDMVDPPSGDKSWIDCDVPPTTMIDIPDLTGDPVGP